MISFWILATCECGVFASADIDFCLYCTGGSIFVDHRACGPKLTSYHEYRCPRRDAALDPQPETLRDDSPGDTVVG